MKNRLYYLDHIRVILTVLVLFHHAALPYTHIEGVWYLSDAETGSSVTSALLGSFISLNQAFFMGFFFFLSGYFTPISFARKTTKQFVIDRLCRLGIPFLLYLFILSPIVQFMVSSGKQSFWFFYRTQILTLNSIETGPLWFAEVLLLFTFLFVLYQIIVKKRPSDIKKSFPAFHALLTASLLLGIITFFVRIMFPIGFWIFGIQIAYLPSYLFFFFTGIIAGRRKWLVSIPKKTTKKWLWIFAGVSPLFPLSTLFFHGNVNGGLNASAAIYALWEPVVAFGICLILLALFKKYANETNAIWNKLSQSAFTVYIIHPVILVGLAILFINAPIHSFLQFLMIGTFGTILTFLAALLIIKVPYAKRIL